MQRKSKKITLFLTFIVCFAFSLGVNFQGLNKRSFAGAEEAPNLTELQQSSGDNWSYSNNILSLNSVAWDGCLKLNDTTTINLTGENFISSEDYGIQFGDSLTFTGTGSLTITVEDGGELFLSEEGRIILGEGLKIYTETDELSEREFYSDPFEDLTEIVIIARASSTQVGGVTASQSNSQISQQSENLEADGGIDGGKIDEGSSGGGDDGDDGSEQPEHAHSFKYETSGNVLTVSCTAENCDLGSSATASLEVSDIDYGGTLSVALDFSNVNTFASLSLSLENSTQTYYSGESATGTALEAQPTNAGTYTLQVSFKIAETDYSLTKTFTINKISYGNQISWKIKEIEYLASYDVSQMFTTPENVGAKSYEIVSGDGTTGEGTISGSTLTITKCGDFQIKLTIAETANYKQASLTGSLTVIKRGLRITPLNMETEINYSQLVNDSYDISNYFEVGGKIDDVEYKEKTYAVKKAGDVAFTSIEGTSYTFTEAGDYVFKCMIEENDFYRYSECEIELTLEKLNPTLTFSQADWTYGDQSSEYFVTAKINNVVYDYSKYYLGTSLSVKYYSDSGHRNQVTSPKNAGTYHVVISLPATKFAYGAETSDMVTIGKKEVAVVWAVDEVRQTGESIELTYNGKDQSMRISAYYISVFKDYAGSDVKKSLNVSVVGELTNVCKTTIVAVFVDDEEMDEDKNSNYTLTGEEIDCLINPAQITVKVSDVHMPYGSNPMTDFSAKITSGEVFGNDELPYVIETATEITKSTDIGKYKIFASAKNDPNGNYDITSIDGTYYVENIITALEINDWIYEEKASTPRAEAKEKSENIKYEYYQGEKMFDSVPTHPGEYQIKAYISMEKEEDKIYDCEKTVTFYINKKPVDAPERDYTNYVYTGNAQKYKLALSEDYIISNDTYTSAGLHQVVVYISDTEFHEWGVSDNYDERISGSVIVYYFVIEKEVVDEPILSKFEYKYTGSPITFLFPTSDLYSVSNLTQTEVGKYTVTVSLVDQTNYKWSGGDSVDIEYEFQINKAEISNPKTVSAKGEDYGSTPVSITEVEGLGIDPDHELSVGVIEEHDEHIKTVKKQLKSSLEKYDKIFLVYDVKLLSDGQEVQPDDFVTLKMAIPKKLTNAKFKLLLVSTDENGAQTVSEIDYGGATEDGYIFVQTDEFSSFVFVYKQNSLKTLIVVFAVIDALLAIGFAIQLVILIKLNKRKSKKSGAVLASVIPVFYVSGEVTASVLLGCAGAVLLACNAVVLALIMKKHKLNQPAVNHLQAVDMSVQSTETKSIKTKITKKD